MKMYRIAKCIDLEGGWTSNHRIRCARSGPFSLEDYHSPTTSICTIGTTSAPRGEWHRIVVRKKAESHRVPQFASCLRPAYVCASRSIDRSTDRPIDRQADRQTVRTQATNVTFTTAVPESHPRYDALGMASNEFSEDGRRRLSTQTGDGMGGLSHLQGFQSSHPGKLLTILSVRPCITSA